MKQGQYSNEQIVAILQEAERGERPIIELCKEKGISEATFYAWRKKFGGYPLGDADQGRTAAQRVGERERPLETAAGGAGPGTGRGQGGTHKKLVAASQKRRFVVLAKEKGLSERAACRLVRLSRTVARYRARPERHDNEILVERLKEIARKKRRRGYRLAHRHLRQEGWRVNHKRVHRLWKLAGLSVPARKSRKRLRRTATPRSVMAPRPDSVWCLDFAEDRTINGTKLRILCVTDEFTRESLALEVGRSFCSERVCQVLEGLFVSRGKPVALRMDNGPEFVALALQGLCHRHGICAAYIQPGKPWQNGLAESFISRLRDEFLDGEVFLSVLDAQVRLSIWRRYYNEERLHSGIGYQAPRGFAASWLESSRGKAETKEFVGATQGG
jgi:putative transposase